MINWVATYWINDNVQEFSSDSFSWDELPDDGIIWVIITDGTYSHRIQGMDNYWISGDTYGMFNNTGETLINETQTRLENGNMEVEYTGHQSVYYKWNGNTIYDNIPNNIIVKKGIMLPDNKAKEFGLI